MATALDEMGAERTRSFRSWSVSSSPVLWRNDGTAALDAQALVDRLTASVAEDRRRMVLGSARARHTQTRSRHTVVAWVNCGGRAMSVTRSDSTPETPAIGR
jgi:hypothetical protein